MTMRAIKIIEQGNTRLVHDAPIPKLRDNYILASTKAFALNPADFNADSIGLPGCTIGCDFSGIVTEVGKNVTKFKKGDEIFGISHSANQLNTDDGAFSDFATAPEFTTWHKSKHLSFEEATTFGAGLITVAQTLCESLQLPFPDEKTTKGSGPSILIYGASTATGTIAVQVAKLSGCTVYTTCSPSNFDLVKSRGADYVFDYQDPSSVEKIKGIAGDSITHILDCIGKDETSTFCSKILSSRGGRYHSVGVPLPEMFKQLRPEDNVYATTAAAFTMFGYDFVMGDFRMPPTPEEDGGKFATKWKEVSEPLILKGLIKPHPPAVQKGGLDMISESLAGMKENGSPSGVKLVHLNV